MRACYKCGHPYVEPGEPPIDALCLRCSSYLHACANCDFYDEYSNNPCREPRAKYISDRQGMNRCEHFRFRRPPRQEKLFQQADAKMKESRARENLDRLFNK